MLTTEDIKKLVEVEKEIFTTKEDFEQLKLLFSNLQSSVDAYAKRADTYFQEMLMLARRVDRIEKWVKEIAEKVGLKLES